MLQAPFGSAITLGADHATVRDISYQWGISAYLETVGTVTHRRMEITGDSEGTAVNLMIHYGYTVNDEQYTGKQYRLSNWMLSEGVACRIIAEFPVGKTVPV